jgi:hypothetical protein
MVVGSTTQETSKDHGTKLSAWFRTVASAENGVYRMEKIQFFVHIMVTWNPLVLLLI